MLHSAHAALGDAVPQLVHQPGLMDWAHQVASHLPGSPSARAIRKIQSAGCWWVFREPPLATLDDAAQPASPARLLFDRLWLSASLAERAAMLGAAGVSAVAMTAGSYALYHHLHEPTLVERAMDAARSVGHLAGVSFSLGNRVSGRPLDRMLTPRLPLPCGTRCMTMPPPNVFFRPR